MKVPVFSIVEGKSFKLCFASTFASHPRPPSLRSFPTTLVPRFRARPILFGPCLTSVHPRLVTYPPCSAAHPTPLTPFRACLALS